MRKLHKDMAVFVVVFFRRVRSVLLDQLHGSCTENDAFQGMTFQVSSTVRFDSVLLISIFGG